MDENEFRQQLLATFENELAEHVSTITSGLLELEKGQARTDQIDLLKELFRAAHSIKGAARAVNLPLIETMAHRIEDLFGAIQGGQVETTGEIIDLILAGVDQLSEAMAGNQAGGGLEEQEYNQVLVELQKALAGEVPSVPLPTKPDKAIRAVEERESAAAPEPGKTEPQAEGASGKQAEDTPATRPSARPVSSARGETIRVSIDKLDALMAGMGELLVAQMRSDQRWRELKNFQQMIGEWEKSWRAVRSDCRHFVQAKDPDPELEPLRRFLTFNESSLKRLYLQMDKLTSRFGDDCRHLTLLTDDMQNSVRRVRMVPVSNLFGLFPRMVRDIAKERDKAVKLSLEGGQTEIDRQILEIVKDPLTHLLRNAVDHGIEPPAERKARKKTAEGSIVVRALQKGNSIVIQVSDDGAGIDLDKVRKKAAGNVGAELPGDSPPDEAHLIELLFHSGFSTLDRPTALSGRGVGLDVVRKNLERLHGRVDVETHPGAGTTFNLTLPLTLATSHALLIETAGQVVAVPSHTVDRILLLDPAQTGSVDGRPVITVNDQVMPLIPLAQVLELPQQASKESLPNKLPVAVLGVAEKRFAFIVDRLLNTQDVVVKQLGNQLRHVRNVSGATILGSGQVVILLNVADLMKSRQSTIVRSAVIDGSAAVPRKRILVVDDSITTRTLEKNILSNAGFEVLTASDGAEGWELIQTETFDAVILDVDMPRMNGIEVTEKVRTLKRLENLPVLLVTSLETENHKIRGMEAGADAYITKGSFDQKELLDTIERLVG